MNAWLNITNSHVQKRWTTFQVKVNSRKAGSDHLRSRVGVFVCVYAKIMLHIDKCLVPHVVVQLQVCSDFMVLEEWQRQTPAGMV